MVENQIRYPEENIPRNDWNGYWKQNKNKVNIGAHTPQSDPIQVVQCESH